MFDDKEVNIPGCKLAEARVKSQFGRQEMADSKSGHVMLRELQPAREWFPQSD